MTMVDATTERVIGLVQRRGVASTSELCHELGISQPTASRALATAGARIVRIGRARRTRYAATRSVRGLGPTWPLYRIDAVGRPHEFGRLTALHGDACLVVARPPPDWLRDEFRDGLFPGLPWFLDDQRPQGFLGMQFARRWAEELGLPPDASRWGVTDLLVALVQRGDDEPGDFVLGDASLARALQAEPEPVPAAARTQRYGAFADAALAGGAPGSSAAGEQPKFTASVADARGEIRHVIVKFSEPAGSSPAARRWADLLWCEHIAAQVLAAHGDPSARTEIVVSRRRVCLEATRFDRVGAHGRRGFVTLGAWSDAHDGARDDWAGTAARMHAGGWLDAAGLVRIQRRFWFGCLIGNTDMHFGNLGFHLGSARPLAPAPGYDVLPMLYRPTTTGAIVARRFEPRPPMPAALPQWREAAAWAEYYWQRVAAEPRISSGFRRIAGANAGIVARLRARFDVV